jgi:A/G-specific adenine glycosylase
MVALVRRPPKGLLGGMLGLPTTDWRAKPWPTADALAQAPAPASWRRLGEIEHTFTHFALTLDIYCAGFDLASCRAGARGNAIGLQQRLAARDALDFSAPDTSTGLP